MVQEIMSLIFCSKRIESIPNCFTLYSDQAVVMAEAVFYDQCKSRWIYVARYAMNELKLSGQIDKQRYARVTVDRGYLDLENNPEDSE